MRVSFPDFVDPILEDCDKITLSDSDIMRLDAFVDLVINKKRGEYHHKVDGYNERKRWSTGIGGEIAIEKFLNKEFVDFSVGRSNDYHVPDLTSINIKAGVKTVEYGKFPIIFKKSYKPEIIVIKKNDRDFFICGLASVNVLNTYQSEDLVLSPSLISRGTKTGFYGFEHLEKFSSYSELLALLYI